MEVFDLCGSLPPLPCSPHVVPSETVSTAESQGQTQQPGEVGGLWNRAGAGRLSLLLEMGATQGPWPRNPLGLTRSDPKGSLCPASLGAVQSAGICFLCRCRQMLCIHLPHTCFCLERKIKQLVPPVLIHDRGVACGKQQQLLNVDV